MEINKLDEKLIMGFTELERLKSRLVLILEGFVLKVFSGESMSLEIQTLSSKG